MEHNECNNVQEHNDSQNKQSTGFNNVLSKIKAFKQLKKEKKKTLSTSTPSFNKFSLSHYNTTPILNDTKLKKLLQMLEPNYNSFTFNKLFLSRDFHNNTNKSSAFIKYNSLFRDLSNYNDSKNEKELSRNIFSFKSKATRAMTPFFTKHSLTIHKHPSNTFNNNNNTTHHLTKLHINNSASLNLSNIKKNYTNKYATIYNDAYYNNKVNNLHTKLNNIPSNVAISIKSSPTVALKPKSLSSNRNRFNYIIREQNNFKSISY